ncbi:MAG: hypothetical protein VX916_02530 [Planctomycetota bacterium]|nr:hypothetical protein [Planctomycetota bacterium]
MPQRDHHGHSLVVPCPHCAEWTREELGPNPATLPLKITCQACKSKIPLDLSAHVTSTDEERKGGASLDGCPFCDYHTLYIQKDINNKFGLMVVVATYLLLLFSGLDLPEMIAGLVILTLLDLILLRLVVRRLLICYHCQSQYRGWAPGPHCRPFDLATWEGFQGQDPEVKE